MSIGDYIRNTQIWKSIFRHPAPRDRRNRVVVMLTNVFLHLHPVSVRKSGIELSYTWCMGGITFFLFLVETVTGVLLMFYYRPTLEHAYNDILSLRDVTTLGIAGGRRCGADPLRLGCAVLVIRGPLRRRNNSAQVLRVALRRLAARGVAVDCRPFLARPERRRHQRGTLIGQAPP